MGRHIAHVEAFEGSLKRFFLIALDPT